MREKVIFHIGLHKTATTSLQVDTFPKIQDLNYLSLREDAVRKYVDHLLACDPIYYPASTKAPALRKLLVSDRTNLISSEALSGPAWVGVSQRGIDHRTPILMNLSHDFSDAGVLLLLRRQDDYARSMYRQYIKAGGTHSLARFLGSEPALGSPLFSSDRFRYLPFIHALKSHFSGNVKVMFFEELLSDGPGFLKKLSQALDCKDTAQQPGRRNSSKLGSRGLQISRGLNRFFRGPLNQSALLPGIPIRRNGRWLIESPVALLQDHWPGKSPTQSQSEEKICSTLLESCREDNRLLAEELDIDLGRFGYY